MKIAVGWVLKRKERGLNVCHWYHLGACINRFGRFWMGWREVKTAP